MEDRGPFDRGAQSEPVQSRDRAAAFIVVLGVVLGAVLLILVLPPISIFDDEGVGSEENPAPFIYARVSLAALSRVARNSWGDCPIQRRKARAKLRGSEYPSRKATSVTE